MRLPAFTAGFASAVSGWLHKLVTGKDNQTPDIVRVLGALMGIQFIVNSGWDLVVHSHEFDATAYGTGAAALLAAIGAALGLKHRAEPEA